MRPSGRKLTISLVSDLSLSLKFNKNFCFSLFLCAFPEAQSFKFAQFDRTSNSASFHVLGFGTKWYLDVEH